MKPRKRSVCFGRVMWYRTGTYSTIMRRKRSVCFGRGRWYRTGIYSTRRQERGQFSWEGGDGVELAFTAQDAKREVNLPGEVA